MEEIIRTIFTNTDNAILVFIGLVLKDLWYLLKFILKNITNKINSLFLEYKQKNDDKKICFETYHRDETVDYIRKIKKHLTNQTNYNKTAFEFEDFWNKQYKTEDEYENEITDYKQNLIVGNHKKEAKKIEQIIKEVRNNIKCGSWVDTNKLEKHKNQLQDIIETLKHIK